VVTCTLILLSCGEGEGPVEKQGLNLNARDEVLDELAELAGVVVLEADDVSTIGEIRNVIVAPGSGNLFIRDRSPERVLSFTADGSFVRAYGTIGEGPGELRSIDDFAVLPDESLVLAAGDKLIRLSESGELLAETKIDFFPEGLVPTTDRVFVQSAGGHFGRPIEEAVFIFDHELKPLGGGGVIDEKFDRFWYSARLGPVSRKGEMVWRDPFAFRLISLDMQSLAMTRYAFPDPSRSFDSLWQKERLSQEDEQEIIRGTCGPSNLLALDSGFFFAEFFSPDQIDRYNLYQPETTTLIQWANDWRDAENNTPWNYLVGSVDNRLIAVLEDPDLLEALKPRFPQLASVTLTERDNPLLLFYEIQGIDAD